MTEPELDRWTTALRRHLRAAGACLALTDGHETVLKSAVTDGGELLDPTRLPPHETPRELLEAVCGAAGAYAEAPVVIEGEQLGVLSVADRRRRRWTEADRNALAETSDAVATAISLRLARAQAARFEELVAAHDHVQELIASGAPLAEVLTEITASVERCEPSLIGCIVLLDPATSTLHPGAGPLLPPEYLAAIDGVVIGPNIGACGSAAWSGELTISQDISTDPRWAPIRDFALACGLRHCWSMPIRGVDESVLGTLALYGAHPRRPMAEHLALQARWARVAGIAIERSRALERLVRDAHFDALTGLPNRSATFQRLERALEAAAPDAQAAVMFVDLDGLKQLNDTLGHDRADEMLQEVARRLQGAVADNDFVGRLGGDEFVVIAEQVGGEDEASSLALRLLERVSEPIAALDGTVVTASIGIGVVAQPDVTAIEAIRQADGAMYEAKRAGRDRCVFSTGDRRVHTGRRLALARELRGVELRDELSLALQPVFAVSGGEIVGAEALLRWDSPRFGQVAPAELVPIAEETGAIIPIGAWVLRESCETMAAVIERTGRPLELMVNVSALQLCHPGFALSVRQTLAHAGLPAQLLALELTETALAREDPATTRTLRELDALGIRVVLDDFGTGLSSLRWLHEHPVGGLKIAPGFVAGVEDEERDRAITAAVVDLGRRLRCQVTAEGVERPEQLSALAAIGCERAQGFLLARPAAVDDLVALLNRPSASALAA
ncbi:MAG: putative bifunctional diguanylate cyclase/phosphodiesterase [Solirubrobacteraceae bacterium]